MAHKKQKEENEIIKTISLKVKDYAGYPIVEAMREYTKYYNKISQWINSNLLTIKIGELSAFMPDECKTHNYYTYMMSPDWVNEPLYKMFMKGFHTQHCDNILFNVVKTLNIDEYTGNSLGLSASCFRRSGYFQNVVSNYKSKFANPHISIRRKNLSDLPTEDELLEQCIYEIQNGLSSKTKWEEQIEYLKERDDSKQIYLKRLNTLFTYYKANKDFVDEQMQIKSVESLANFGGCVRKDDKLSMNLVFSSNSPYKVVLNEKRNGYILSYSNNFSIELYGNRMGLLNGIEMFNIGDKHSNNITFKMDNDELFVNIPVSVNFVKKANETNKVVGVDVNLKHSIFATNIIDDGKLDGFVNIYRELLNDVDFVKSCPNDLLNFILDVEKYVFFMPLELGLLSSRVMNQYGYSTIGKYEKLFTTEEHFLRVLRQLEKRFQESGENQKRIYIENVIKMRAQIKAYVTLKYAYNKANKDYDLKMGFVDESTTNKETMDQRRFENQFVNTDTAKEILGKMRRIANVITSCRNNIICYMYKIFENNGYGVVALEKLQSSQMKKEKRIPSLLSLLKKHKVEGYTINELKDKSVFKFIERGYYTFDFDDDNKITGVQFSDAGEAVNIETELHNLALKTIHFADAKDYFVTLSNNGSVSVALVPSQFTSQMDSTKHVLYAKKNNKGKLGIVSEHEVRPKQERHINGLNGDYNAACNIAYIFENDEWRNAFMKMNPNEYGKALFETNIESTSTIINTLKKINPDNIISFDECEKTKKVAA